MLFEKIRRTQKPVFITLALMFGLGFVFLGVGSGAGGLNPLDFLNNNSSSSVGNISDLNDQVRGNPKDAAAWLKLAEAYEAKGETEPALGAYQQYIGLRPKDTGTLITAAQLYEQDARTVQQQSSTSQSELSTLQSASTAGVSGVKFAQSLSSPLMTALITPLQTQAQTYQSRFTSSLSQAITLWQKLAKIDPTNANYWFAIGNDAAAASDYKTTYDAFTKYLKLRPDDPQKAQIKKYLKEIAPLAKSQSSSTTTPTG